MYLKVENYKKVISILLTVLLVFSIVSPRISRAAEQLIPLANWDFKKGYITTPSIGISENLDRVLSSVGSKVICYNSGPTSGINVINADTWSYNKASYWLVPFSTKGYQNIKLSSKQYSSSDGPRDFKLQYSLDNINWTDVPNGNVKIGNATWETGGQLAELQLPNQVNNRDLVYVRWLVNSNIRANGSTFKDTTGTGSSRITDILIQGNQFGSSTLEKTNVPDATKITFSSVSSVEGTAGAVASNSIVKVFNDDNTLAGSTTAKGDGSFSLPIQNPQDRKVIYLSAQEDGKDPSDKTSVNYTGTNIERTALPLVPKITYSSYTKLSGNVHAVANNAIVKLYFEDGSEIASTIADGEGSFSFDFFSNPQSKSVVYITAQEIGKVPSEKVIVNYASPSSDISPGDVVFSQVYANGGNPGAFFKTKFFELYNTTDKDIDLTGWSIASTIYSTMSFCPGRPIDVLNSKQKNKSIIKAHGYYLVQGVTGDNGQSLPVNADSTTSLNPNGSKGGALVLAKKDTAVTGVNDPDVVDLVAYTDGTEKFLHKEYWDSPIINPNIARGTILRRTNVGSDPRSALGMGNGWFPPPVSDPSKDFVLNIPVEASDAEEMVIHNSAYILYPDASKITFDESTSSIVGHDGSVPGDSMIKMYDEDSISDPKNNPPQEVKATSGGSFELFLSDIRKPTVVYLTYTDTSQPTEKESVYTKINLEGSKSTIIPIGELRKNDSTELPLNIGYTTTIEGIATTINNPGENVKSNFFIQDETGGINVISNRVFSAPIKVGNKYSITGQEVFTAGMTQFIPTTINDLGAEGVPIPNRISIENLNEENEKNESKLVTITGKVLNIASDDSQSDLTVSDNDGNLSIVRIPFSLGEIKQGLTYSFTGIVEQYAKVSPYNSGYFLLPRSFNDIKGQLELNHTVIKNQYSGLDANFIASAKYADTVSLYYKGENDESYKSIKMNTTDEKNYNAKIDKEDVPRGKFFYYIQAKNNEETKSVGSSDTPNEVKVVEDHEGPEFTKMLPMDKEEIETQYPTISVNMNDPDGVDPSTATISIDDKDYSSNAIISDSEIKLVLSRDSVPLQEGAHTIRVSAKDRLGNLSAPYEWSFTVKKRFSGGHHYRGTTHNHTNISHDAKAQGSGTPEEALIAAKNYKYDFFAFSDHSHDIDNTLINQDTVIQNGMKERTGGEQWQLTKTLAGKYTNNGNFVVFPGFEMSSTTWGHSNVLGSNNFIDRIVDGGKYQNLQNFYAWALTKENIVGQFNHPNSPANAFSNFIPYNKEVDRVFTMFEIGNGPEISYTNSEKKYFNALDLGWHVAPTYGEDNHTGTWGQTKKRTVIVADDLTEASLLDSMKNRRVYMSEDPNFTLNFSANRFYMGSTVDTNQLDFTVEGSDSHLEKASDPEYNYLKTESNDAIEKVELITNQMKVVQTYIPSEDLTSFDWKPDRITVADGQQWFVVKVTQKDGDRIYSSPIWSKEDEVAVNVNKINSDGKIVEGESTKLTAEISNKAKINVNDISANFYYDQIDSNHFIGETKIDALEANNSGSASIVWGNPVAGTHKIIVTLSDDNDYYLGNNENNQVFEIYKNSSIEDARNTIEGKNLVIEGTVTATSFNNSVNIQDDTGGIKAIGELPEGSLNVGDKIRVYGKLKMIENEPVLEFDRFINDIVKIGSGKLIEPKVVSTLDSNAEENQGLLIKVTGKVISIIGENSYEIDDSSGPALVYVDDYIINQSGPVPILKVGDTLEAIGIATKNLGENRIRVRNTKELIGTDTSIPDAPIVNPVSDKDLFVLGKAEPGSQISAKIDGQEIGISLANDEGIFEIKLYSKLIAGTKMIVTATDSAGNESAGTELIISDETAPVISGVVDKGLYNHNVTVDFNEGTATLNDEPIENAKVVHEDGDYTLVVTDAAGNDTKVRFTIDQTAPVVEGVEDGFYNGKVTISFNEGTATLNGEEIENGTEVTKEGTYKLEVTDKAGNVTTVNFRIDLTAPKVTGVADKGLYNHDVTIEFEKDTTATLNGKEITSGYKVSAEGTYKLVVKDQAGNEATVNFAIDKTAPKVTGVVNKGLYNHDVTISFSEGTATLDNKVFKGGKVSKEGSHTLVVKDEAGNVTSVSFTIDKTAPVVYGVSNGGSYNHDVKIGFTEGTATLNGTKITNGKVVKAEGSYTVVVTDAAGNKTTVKFTIDKTAPVVSGVKNNVLYNKSVKISFNERAALLDGKPVTSGTVVSKEGKHILVVKDAAGNKTTVTFTIDKTAPAKPKVDKVTSTSTRVTGKAEAYSYVVVKAGSKVLGKDYADKHGYFSAKISKQKAGKTLTVTAQDKAGNVSKGTTVTVKK
ncbi:Ig-like domain-containing protein [Bacillus sp. UNC438CL73TsuS30]|uniref:Ig-like domain-containing protein n=1 Tax=Bacillus sp. UNC438CL73TsuS30 TaxID=1340434 RepID=UPI00047B1E93|nr:Ig-like domain-containing protein [Bacillus sp. UNC438CL73TsuS30]